MLVPVLAGGEPAALQTLDVPKQIAVSRVDDYRIGPADVLQVSVWRNDALTQTVTVRPDGKISFPLVNDIRAAGLTPLQLRDALASRLTVFIGKPEVSVVVRELHSFAVSVLGEVRKAGRYEINMRATVLDILAQAGGINEFAARSRIFILRPDGENMKRLTFNYADVTSESGVNDNFYVEPGDIVVVP